MIQFYKYHGAGNDFILFNAIENPVDFQEDFIEELCHRQFGIGADGLMILLPSNEYDFEMKYYNSNGQEGSMCGNGGRCLISFAYDMGIQNEIYTFKAIDGLHKGRILEITDKEKTVELEMIDVNNIQCIDQKYVLDTGSPHYIEFRENVKDIDVFAEGQGIRYSEVFEEEGINVNFVEVQEDKIFVRTYERGVENETLACGTGVTAAAIATSIQQQLKYKSYDIQTLGGNLQVKFESVDSKEFTNILLIGPAKYVFTGAIDL